MLLRRLSGWKVPSLPEATLRFGQRARRVDLVDVGIGVIAGGGQ
jgi:hypothetical protein